MRREIELSQITDGKKYTSKDIVRIGTNGCQGCSECCRIVGDTIVLDPRDIYELERVLSLSFNALLESYIDLRVVDGLIQPNLRIRDDALGCVFLDEAGRCSIHDARPGFCRMYPLGRLYEDDSFSYILQVQECPSPNKSKVQIDKWIGIPNLKRYESYINTHHRLVRQLQELMDSSEDEQIRRSLNMLYLQTFYAADYDTAEDFYLQFTRRMNSLINTLGLR